MIDCRRWVLVEAWLSLGLRVEWSPSYAGQRDNWQLDDDTGRRYVYAGRGLWLVRDDERLRPGFSRPTVPDMGLTFLRHELAHYLAATADGRAEENFGLVDDVADALSSDGERRALEAERVVDAMLQACARVAEQALCAPTWRVSP